MAKHLIGIDIGGTMIKGALFNEQAEILEKFETPSHPEKDADSFILNIIEFVQKIKNNHTGVKSLGIGIAGLIDTKREILIESPNLPELKNTPLSKEIQNALKIPVYIENDANIAALGELSSGEGINLNNFLLMTLGTGLGSGLILNGELITGETGKGCEFGHIIVQPDGELCGCGKRGCLEAYCSGSAMIRMAVTALQNGRASCLMDLYKYDPSNITPKAIYTAAETGDELSHEIFRCTAKYLAVGISNVNNLLDIHTFIIGGGVSKGLHLIREGLIEEVKKNVFDSSKDKIDILISKLGNDAGILGAGFLAKKGLV